jgi:membrane fusion protein (multidrug efflux system)
MARKIIQIVIGLALIAVGVFGFNKFKSMKKAQDKQTGKSVRYVRTIKVENSDINSTIPITGRLTAREKISVIAEVMGRLQETPKDFKEGVAFNKGEVLLKIDPKEFQMNLLAQKSGFLNLVTQMMPDLKLDYPEGAKKWQEFIDAFELDKPLPDYPDATSNQEKYFLASRNIYQQYYSIKSLEERLAKYIIRAPFDGTVSMSNVYPGMTVPIGQMLGEFLNPSSYEIDAAVNTTDINFINIGDEVKLASKDLNQTWTGKVIRISDKIDPSTQSIKIIVSVSGKGLKEGLYLQGEIKTGVLENSFELPRKLLVENSFVYSVEDTMLHENEVEVLKINRSSAIVKGLEDGTVLLDESLPGAYEGMPVRSKSEREKVVEERIEENQPETSNE